MLDQPDEAVERVAGTGIIAPRAGDWFWRPRYARLWWMGAAIFWLLAFTLPTTVFRDIPEGWDTMIFAAMMLFHPFVMLPVLGFGFARAWVAAARVEAADETLPSSEARDSPSIFRWRGHDPYSVSPPDPRSPLNPLNPMSEAWRRKNLWPRR